MCYKFFKFGLIAVASAMLASCNSSSSVDGDVEYLPVQVERDGKWAMIDGKGKLLFGEDFKNEPSAVVNGLFSVKEGDNYTLYSASAKPKEICSDLVAVGVYREGVIPATPKQGRINLLDGDGKVKATLNPVGGKEIVRCDLFVNDGMLVICDEEGNFGYADKSGKVIIEPKYRYAYQFSEGVAVVVKEINDESVVMAIDNKGKEVFRVKKGISLGGSRQFKNGMIPAKDDDGRCGFINKKGEFNKLNGKVHSIGDYDSKYFAFENSDYEWGLMDMSGEQIIKPKYGSLQFLSDGKYLAKDGEEYIVLNNKGDKQMEISDYSNVIALDNGHFSYIARDRSKYVLLDKDGKQIGKEDYADIDFNLTAMRYESSVMTDYFNNDAVVQALLGQLTNGGFDKYRIGMPASDLGITDYSNYVYSYNYSDPSLEKNGWRYRVNFKLSTDYSIATREYDSYYNSAAVKNPDAKVESISISVDADVSCWKEIKDALISGIQAKGYTIADSSADWVEFNGKDCKLTLNSSYNGTEIYMRITAVSSQVLSNGNDAEMIAAEEEAEVAE